MMEQCAPPFVYHPNICSHSQQYSSEREKMRTRRRQLKFAQRMKEKYITCKLKAFFLALGTATHTSDLFALHRGPPSMLGVSQFQANDVGSYYYTQSYSFTQEYNTFMLMLAHAQFIVIRIFFFTASRKTENELYKFVYISQNGMAQYMAEYAVYGIPPPIRCVWWCVWWRKKRECAHIGWNK